MSYRTGSGPKSATKLYTNDWFNIFSTRLSIGKVGGARRDRTDDLMLAKHALSQLSYGP